MLSRIHTGTLTKMINKSSKNTTFTHTFASISTGLWCIFMNHPQPRFSGLFPRFLLRGFLRLPIVDFEPSRAKITKARSTFQASSSREVKDGKLSSHLFILVFLHSFCSVYLVYSKSPDNLRTILDTTSSSNKILVITYQNFGTSSHSNFPSFTSNKTLTSSPVSVAESVFA